jgi:ribosomal protein S18 acetylase RimI-like enzyme
MTFVSVEEQSEVFRTMKQGKMNDSNFVFRLAIPADTPAIIDVCRAAGAFSEAEALSAGDDITDYHNLYLNRDRVLVCQAKDGRLAGFAHFSPASITQGTWYIYWIAVAQHFQGKGLGKQLIRQAESEIKKINGRLLLIETAGSKPEFEPARRLYTTMGYSLKATIPEYFAPGDDKNIYWKLL